MDQGDSLMALVCACKWDEALKQIESKSKPESESFANEKAITAQTIPATTANILLYACRSIAFHKPPPLKFIEKLLLAKPHPSTSVTGEYGSANADLTPLHLLFHYRTNTRLRLSHRRENIQLIEDIALLIIETDPNSLLQPLESSGFLPLHSLLSNCLRFNNDTGGGCYEGLLYNGKDDNDEGSHNFLQTILTINPKCLILPNKGHVTCFEMFWNAFCTTYDDNTHREKLLLCPKTAHRYYYEHHVRRRRRRKNENKERRERTNMIGMIGTIETRKERYTKNMYSCFIAVIQLAALATCDMTIQKNLNVYNDIEKINLDNDEKYDEKDEDGHESKTSLFLPLHSVISISCAPVDMIKFVLSVHGNNEIRMLDSQGNTPLHKSVDVITINVNTNSSNVNINKNIDAATATATRNKPNVQRSLEDTKKIIQMLLQMDSHLASIQNNQGYFPFFLALQQQGMLGWDDGVCVLLDAYPEVMSHVDPVFHFNPFIYSLLTIGPDVSDSNDEFEQRKGRINQLNISFQLLRKYPDSIYP